MEVAGLSAFVWLASAQYAAPLLRNSLNKMVSMNIALIAERLMKLSTVSLIIWLAGFFAVFHSMLNALAEVMRFGDRAFYDDVCLKNFLLDTRVQSRELREELDSLLEGSAARRISQASYLAFSLEAIEHSTADLS